jgi:hypothetical protein
MRGNVQEDPLPAENLLFFKYFSENIKNPRPFNEHTNPRQLNCQHLTDDTIIIDIWGG